MAKLYIFTGAELNQSFELKGNSIYIGRSQENDVQIFDVSVSRRHLKVFEKDNRFFIKDLNSRNGTYINGIQIPAGVDFEIKEHDPIVIGMSVICVGKKCLDYVAPLISSLGYPLKEKPEYTGTTFARPLTNIRNNQLISNVSNILHVSKSVNEVTSKLLDHILNHFLRVDRVVIILCVENEKGEITETVVTRSRKKGDSMDDNYSRAIVDRVISNKKPIVIPNTLHERELDLSETLKLLKIGSVMCAPIVKESKIIGVLYIDSYDKPYGFRDDDLSLLSRLSDLTANALETYLVPENVS